MNQSRRDLLEFALKAAPAVILPFILKPGTIKALSMLGGGSPTAGRTLVVIQLAGGNDGLNTVIPVTDNRYYSARPGLAIPQDQAIKLNAETGLHPSLAKFKELWDEGVLAIVEGVEYPNPSFSHFQSMQIWQTSDPSLTQTEGWLGQYLDDLGTAPPELGSGSRSRRGDAAGAVFQ